LVGPKTTWVCLKIGHESCYIRNVDAVDGIPSLAGSSPLKIINIQHSNSIYFHMIQLPTIGPWSLFLLSPSLSLYITYAHIVFIPVYMNTNRFWLVEFPISYYIILAPHKSIDTAGFEERTPPPRTSTRRICATPNLNALPCLPVHRQ
jgi:hypothetical protein